jgi:hypothetical protein
VGLGLLKLKEKDFLKMTTFESGYRHLMSPLEDADAACEVMRVAFDKLWIGKFSMKTIKNLRSAHSQAVSVRGGG